MSVFVVCSAAASAGLAIAFEVGKVCEKRNSGSSKLALPFQGFDWQSEDAKYAAKVCAGLFVFEVCFLPVALNPFSYVVSSSEGDLSFVSSILAFFVFGSWSGILAMGYGIVAASVQGLHNDRVAFESEKSDHAESNTKAAQALKEEEARITKEQRLNVASAAAVAGEWKKLHVAREENHNDGMIRSQNEKIWSTNTQDFNFNKKTMHVVDNAIDKRWREVEDQGTSLEIFRMRNKEKEQQIKEQRARRAERASSQANVLAEEKSNLLKLTNELESLKTSMEKIKEENTRKEQEKIKALKDRELFLKRKERELEETHQEKLERLKKKESALKATEERFESGEERRKLVELEEQLESSKLTVARFNEGVMMKEKQQIEELRKRELALRKREEEVIRLVAVAKMRAEADKKAEANRIAMAIANADADAIASAAQSELTPEPVKSEEEMPDDEASSHFRCFEEEGPDDEIERVLTEMESATVATELPMIKEVDAVQPQVESERVKNANTVDTDDKSVSIRLLAERDILLLASTEDELKSESTASDLPSIEEDPVAATAVAVLQPLEGELDVEKREPDTVSASEDEMVAETDTSVDESPDANVSEEQCQDEDEDEESVGLNTTIDDNVLSHSVEKPQSPDANDLEEQWQKEEEDEDEESVGLNTTIDENVVSHSVEKTPETIPTEPPLSLMDLESDEEEEEDVENVEETQELTTDYSPVIIEQYEDEKSVVIDKCGSEKSLFDKDEEVEKCDSNKPLLDLDDDDDDIEESDEEEIEESDEEEIDDSDKDVNDGESAASTCMFNVHHDHKVAAAIEPTVVEKDLGFLAQIAHNIEKDLGFLEERFAVEEEGVFGGIDTEFEEIEPDDSKDLPPMESDSDSDSLSHQIQQDIAAKEQAEEPFKMRCLSSINTFSSNGESIEEDVLSVSSPLQERNTTESLQDDDVTMSSKPYTKNNALSIPACHTFDKGYVIFPEKENKTIASPKVGKKLHENVVVSEEAAVEVIAWTEPGQI